MRPRGAREDRRALQLMEAGACPQRIMPSHRGQGEIRRLRRGRVGQSTLAWGSIQQPSQTCHVPDGGRAANLARARLESDGGQRPASFAYRRENRKKQKISSSVRRQHNTIPPATKPRPAGEARGTFYVATTFNQTIGAWNVASVKYMAPAVGRNRAHHFE
jgi:hypothetical protein